MVARGNLYSNFVTLAKIVLPLAAIALLASLFLLADGPRESQSIPYSDVELDEIISGQRLARPSYRSVLADGSPLAVRAERAIPDPTTEGRIKAEDITVEMISQDAVRTYLTAPRGVFDEASQTGAATGGVRVERSDGYVATTPGLRATILGDRIETLGPLLAFGPGIRLEAGSGRLTQDPNRPGTEVLVFTGGVKLIYDAQSVSEQ